MVCQPCAAAPSGTVLHGLMYHMVQTGQIEEGSNMAAAASRLSQGIVQRLDKQTSGIMIVAKTLAASSKLSKLFRKVRFKKRIGGGGLLLLAMATRVVPTKTYADNLTLANSKAAHKYFSAGQSVADATLPSLYDVALGGTSFFGPFLPLCGRGGTSLHS